MTTANTSLLGLALPVTGELTGTWGYTVNDSITSLLDTAVAGTTTLSTDADVTLSTTVLAANEARQAILLWTASGTVTRNITAPAQSKTYVVINATGSTQSIVLRGAGPTTGVTIIAGEKCVAAWNGSDFVKISTSVGVTSFSAGTTGLTPSTATTGAITLSGTLGVTNGGTGLSTLSASRVPYGNGTSAFSNTDDFSFNGSTLRVGNQALLGGATNPIIGTTGSANGYIQTYIYNESNSASSSADFVAYASGSTDAHGWADIGFTSPTYSDAAYSVTGPNEAYVFGSATTSSYTGNLVYATDSTGSANSHQWYVGGFNQAKAAWRLQLTSTLLQARGTLQLMGSSSGYVGLKGATAAGSVTYTLPSTDGTSGQVLSTDGSGTLSWSAGGGSGITTGKSIAMAMIFGF